MLKRILSVGIALPATIVALAIYWIALMPNVHVLFIQSEPWIKLAVAVTAIGLAIYFFARRRTWPALLFLIGSIPAVLLNISMVGWEWRMQRYYSTDPPVDDPRLASLFPGENEHSIVNSILFYILFLTLCVPVAFFWYFFTLIHRHLTKRWS
jgi:hypothetical protein